ncbi:unnamed protein product, partial [Meganyctiphanes norvegica]
FCFVFASVPAGSVLGSEFRRQVQGPRNCAEVYQAGERYEGYYAIFPNTIKPDEVDLVYCGVVDGMAAFNSSAPKENAKNCKDLKDGGMSEDGINIIYPYVAHPDTPVIVYCDQTIMGGGWTVFQRRDDYSTQVDFYRNFDEYALGFGSPGAEFWLGNEIIHELTQQGVNELYVDLTSFAGLNKYAHYDIFNIGPRSGDYDGNFQLTIGHYSGTAGDSLKRHNGIAFTTYDVDNDNWSADNCASNNRHGAWWYDSCADSNLNGRYFDTAIEDGTAVLWYSFSESSLMSTKMMTRPLQQQ